MPAAEKRMIDRNAEGARRLFANARFILRTLIFPSRDRFRIAVAAIHDITLETVS
jgi:hypothetical protein